MRGEAEAAHGFLDAPLAVEVRDARTPVRRSHGCVDVVFDAGLARRRRKTLALRLFPLGARLPRALHAVRLPPQAAQMEPGALQRLRDRAALIARHSGDENRSIACHG